MCGKTKQSEGIPFQIHLQPKGICHRNLITLIVCYLASKPKFIVVVMLLNNVLLVKLSIFKLKCVKCMILAEIYEIHVIRCKKSNFFIRVLMKNLYFVYNLEVPTILTASHGNPMPT